MTEKNERKKESNFTLYSIKFLSVIILVLLISLALLFVFAKNLPVIDRKSTRLNSSH